MLFSDARRRCLLVCWAKKVEQETTILQQTGRRASAATRSRSVTAGAGAGAGASADASASAGDGDRTAKDPQDSFSGWDNTESSSWVEQDADRDNDAAPREKVEANYQYQSQGKTGRVVRIIELEHNHTEDPIKQWLTNFNSGSQVGRRDVH